MASSFHDFVTSTSLVLGLVALIRGAGDDTPRLLASRIVSLAHRKDSGSDATAVVIRVRDSRDHGWLELSRPPRDVAFGHAMTYA